MADIVITEFMDEAAVGRLVQAYDTLYDPKLVDDPAALHDHPDIGAGADRAQSYHRCARRF
jgi:hypothetical protein